MIEIWKTLRNGVILAFVMCMVFALGMMVTAYEMREAHLAELQSIKQSLMENDASMQRLCESGELFKFERGGLTYFCMDSRILDELEGMVEPQDSPARRRAPGEEVL